MSEATHFITQIVGDNRKMDKWALLWVALTLSGCDNSSNPATISLAQVAPSPAPSVSVSPSPEPITIQQKWLINGGGLGFDLTDVSPESGGGIQTIPGFSDNFFCDLKISNLSLQVGGSGVYTLSMDGGYPDPAQYPASAANLQQANILCAWSGSYLAYLQNGVLILCQQDSANTFSAPAVGGGGDCAQFNPAN